MQWRALTVQTDAALALDGLVTVVKALDALLKDPDTRTVFKTFRHGVLFNNDTRGIQCWSRPVLPWVHGKVIKEALSKVCKVVVVIVVVVDVVVEVVMEVKLVGLIDLLILVAISGLI